MAIRVAINHKTEYRFDRLVEVPPHVVRLRPAPHCRTPIYAYSLKTQPDNHFINWQQDPFGNHLARFVFPDRARSLCLEADDPSLNDIRRQWGEKLARAFEELPQFTWDGLPEKSRFE